MKERIFKSLTNVGNFIKNNQLIMSSENGLIDLLSKDVTEKYIVVFLVHHLHAWFSISEIWRVMNESPDFLPLAISIPHRFKNSAFVGEEEVHKFLMDNHVYHIRFNFTNHGDGLNILKSLSPDILVRQSHWDKDIPAPYNAANLDFTKLLYTDYGLEIIEDTKYFPRHDGSIEKDGPYDSALHRRAWMICCANKDQRNLYERENPTLKRIFVTGYPKFDAICRKMKHGHTWPIRGTDGEEHYRIIWAPHHSIGQHPWFGTFDYIYKDMLAWALREEDIEIVLRPHPALLEQASVPSMPHFKEKMATFLNAWLELPNTALSLNDNYAALFAASDCMVTDGVSFLSEYPLSGKPLIFFNNPNHTPFNSLGQRCMKAAYDVKTVRKLQDVVKQLRSHHDPLAREREELKKYLMPYPGHAAQTLVDTVRKELIKYDSVLRSSMIKSY